jgi:AraC-like DNA-binding protein
MNYVMPGLRESAFGTMMELVVAGTPVRACFTDFAMLTDAHADLALEYDRYQIHSSPFCMAVKKGVYGESRCLRCKMAAIHKAGKTGPYVGVCHMGLVELVFPVRISGRLAGILHAGQVRITGDRGMNPREMEKRASRAGVNPAVLMKAWKKVPAVPAGLLSGEMRRRLSAVESFLAAYHRAEPFKALLSRPERAPVPQESQGLRGLARRHWLSGRGIEIVRREYNKELRTRRVAGRLGVSESVFCQAFKADTGMTFKDYLTEVRVGVAKKLLVDSGSSSTYVGLEAGFSDPNYFCRVFRREVGLSPTAYREKFWKVKK